MAELATSLRQDTGKRDAGDRQRALDAAIGQIERAFGKGSVMRLGQQGRAVEIETVSTGSLGLDLALGVGGLPRGRIVEIYGPNPPARPRSPCTASPRRKRPAGPAPSSTPSTPSTRAMRGSSGSTSTSS